MKLSIFANKYITWKVSDKKVSGYVFLFEDDQNNQDDEAVMSLLNLFNSDCNLSTSFNIRDLVNEVNSIQTQQEQDLERLIQQKVQKGNL